MLRLTLRNLFARKVRLLMSGLAIILGVAFLSGVLIFSNGLSATFDNIVNGSTPDGVVRAEARDDTEAGMSGVTLASLSPAVVTELEEVPEVARADGDVVGFGMSLLAEDGTVVGGTGAPTLAFNYHNAPNMAGDQILLLEDGRWPHGPGEVALDSNAAEAGGYDVGDEVKLVAPYGVLQRTATLVGIASFNGGGTAGATLLVFSTEDAQQIFLQGKDEFSQITLTAEPGVTQQELAAAAKKVIPSGFEAVTGDEVAKQSQDTFGSFLDVISTFLLVFAVIAVIVGGFIIVNTFSILVAQRTRELALVRALGASRPQVTRSVLLEAFVLAVLGSTIGIGLGLLLARGLAAAFRAVGLDISSSALDLTLPSVVTSYFVGIVVTMLAAYLPARRAGKTPPVAAMRADVVTPQGSLRRRTTMGVGPLLVGTAAATAGVLNAPGSDALWVGIGGVIWILTIAVISPVVGRPVVLSCRALFGRLFGTTGRLAGENALRDPRRTGATASALMIGLALVSMIGVLAASMSTSVDDIVDEEFHADFLVQGTMYMPFSTTIGDEISQVNDVEVMSRQQEVGATIVDEGAPPGADQSVSVTAVDAEFDQIYPLEVVAGTQEVSGAQVVIDEDIAEQADLHVGDRIELAFPGRKLLDLEVVGIVEPTEATADLTMPLDQIAEAGLQRQDSVVSVLLAPGADTDEIHDALDEVTKSAPIVGVYDKAEYAEQIRGQINQLLYMIYGLLALAIVIAVIGIVNTLGLSVIERTREIGLLRAIGMSRTQVWRMITLESVTISVLGAVLGMALGLLIGTLLRESMKTNLTSLALPVGQVVVFLCVAVVVGVLAAVIPAIRASRLNVLEAIAAE